MPSDQIVEQKQRPELAFKSLSGTPAVPTMRWTSTMNEWRGDNLGRPLLVLKGDWPPSPPGVFRQVFLKGIWFRRPLRKGEAGGRGAEQVVSTAADT